jgi:hypothetical protein
VAGKYGEDAESLAMIERKNKSVTHTTAKVKLNIVPNCQISARKGQYGASDSSGAGFLP